VRLENYGRRKKGADIGLGIISKQKVGGEETDAAAAEEDRSARQLKGRKGVSASSLRRIGKCTFNS